MVNGASRRSIEFVSRVSLLARISVADVQQTLNRFGDQRGDGVSGRAEHRVISFRVGMPTDADRMIIVIAEERLHVGDGDVSPFFADELFHA